MKCIPCRVTVEGKRYEVARDGSVRETWAAVTRDDGTETGTRFYGLPLGCDEAAAVRREAQRQRRNRNARDRADALRSLGMKRTLSGTWE
jgi:hypothetical protein